jgi:heme-degrading monooxygenase HmoA
MFARVITAQAGAEGFDEVVRLVQHEISGAQQRPGFGGFYLLTDDETGKLINISLWETREEMEAVARGTAAGIHDEAVPETGVTSLRLEPTKSQCRSEPSPSPSARRPASRATNRYRHTVASSQLLGHSPRDVCRKTGSVMCAGEGTTPGIAPCSCSGASERLPARLRCPAPSHWQRYARRRTTRGA